MVFNPVYIQKSNEGESQLFGSGFANQKTTYLFSDIIKVILSKTEVDGNNTELENNGILGQHNITGDSDSLIISDAEVELYEKLMKLNITNADAKEIQKMISEDPSVLLESLHMYFAGLTNENESVPVQDKSFEIDNNDLEVVLNILAGNALKSNDIKENGINVSEELKTFVAEVNEILGSLEKSNGKYLVIKHDNVAIELHPLKNGKMLVEIEQNKTNGLVDEKIQPDVKDETENSPVSEKQIKIPTEIQASENEIKTDTATKIEWKVQNAVDPLKNNGVTQIPPDEIKKSDRIISSTKHDNNNVQQKLSSNHSKPVEVKTTIAIETKKDVAINQEAANDKVDYTVKNDKTSEYTIDAKENKIIFNNKTVTSSEETKKNNVDVNKISSMPESKEFFEGKIKVDIVTVKDVSAKQKVAEKETVEFTKYSKLTSEVESTQTKQTDINDVKVVNKSIMDEFSKKINKNTFGNIIDTEDHKAEVKTNSILTKEAPTESKNVFSNESVVNVENESLVKTGKLSVNKEEKVIAQKHVADSQNSFRNEAYINSEIINDNPEQQINPAIIDKKNNAEKESSIKSELSEVLSSKEKTAKTVNANNETDKQKSDNQQSNNFEKAFSAVNKAEHIGKDIKETIKVVEQSRLINEIENIIKSGEKKSVTINLYPEELGSVKVSLEISDKSVVAKINVANDSVRQMLITQADNLKTSLNQSGIQLASLNVSVNNSEDKSTPQGKMKRKESGIDKKIVISDIPNPVKVKNLGYNTYDYIA